MTLAEPVQITRRIAVVFEKLKIPYYVVGSLASSLHGIPRATADVDLMADIKEQNVQSLFHLLQDVLGVLRIVDKRLDFIYLKDRAKKKGLISLLDEVLAQVADS